MITNVAVIGAGTMGNGIAHVFALAGCKVSLVDLNPDQLEKALGNIEKNLRRQVEKGTISAGQQQAALENITALTEIEEGVRNVSLVVEAASENIDLKLRIFRELDAGAPPGCILASNTSSISITRIAAATARPGQVIGMHFMNPVPLMKLVEVINGYATFPETTEKIVSLASLLGKQPCVVNDYPGFIANRILMPMINEAIACIHEGVAGVEETDTVMKLGMAHPMGPLQLADFIGLDICFNILKVLQEGFGNPKFAPNPLLVNMVMAGKLGVKSGEGFYIYAPGSKALVVSPAFIDGR